MKAFLAGLRKKHILSWSCIALLALLAFYFFFCVPGCGFAGMVCSCVIGVLLFYKVARKLEGKLPKTVRVVRRIFTLCLCVGLLIVGITECVIIGASFGDPTESCEYIVVLGAKVRHDGPSVSLMDRITAAGDYMNAHPEVIAVVSGGQGSDEPMSEAQCMYEHLVAMGIDENRIWMEDQAASTWANLNYALDLIEEKTGTRPQKLGIISSEYHMLRAGMLAEDCGVEPVRIPARTSLLSQRVNHFLREIAGVWHYLILGGQYD